MEYSPLIFFLVLSVEGCGANSGVRRNLLKRAGKQWLVDAKAGSRCFLMFEWKWLELASFFFSFHSQCCQEIRSSCFKHLQMVMHQQLVSVQRSYCRGIKKTGQSWRCTANLPCRVGEHFPWKKRSYIPAEIDRTVLPWSQCFAWQRRPHGQASQMLRRQGSVELGGLLWVYPPPCRLLPSAQARAREHGCPTGWAPHPPTTPWALGEWWLDRGVNFKRSESWFSSLQIHHCFLASLPRPGRGRRKIS